MYSWFDGDGPAAASADGRRLRTALSQFATGVCLVTTVGQDGKREGMTINSFAAVSLQPPLVLWSIRDDARSGDVFLASGRFVLSVLSEKQQALALHFARPAADKFDQFEAEFDSGFGGCPTLRRALATFSCSTYSRHKEGDHIILIGKVEQFASEGGVPLVTHAGKLGGIGEFATAP
jgi:flavin reductase (DIM6/NTAB) family NADH-FMN oxidoreductase RutF